MLEKVIDKTQPEGKWEFNKSVAAAFDDMLARSIPQYDIMRDACFRLACDHVQTKTDIVDLGCSRGEAMSKLILKYGAYNRFVGVEISKPMADICRERFKGYIDSGIVTIREDDLRRTYPPVSSSVTLAVLTLQFTPIEHRLRIIQNIYDSTLPGGCLILVEKILGDSAQIDNLFVKHYYELKKENGYSQDDIERKRLSLEGVLVPVTERWNRDMLLGSGFKKLDCFWRWMNFAGWIAIK
jgi:tRNA (cmo5U34)-methyltransferase